MLAFATCPAGRLSAQSVTVYTAGSALHVRASGFGFIKGPALDRLKDGRSLRVAFELGVLEKTGAPAMTSSRQSFILSYDLWEERFAVTQTGTPSRSISHLSAADAEAWSLERLMIPLSALGRLGGDRPFWIRLEYRVQDGDRAADADDAGFTLRGLIDRLSRRSKAAEAKESIESGPFHLSN
jgi:hypothetical protein